MGHITCTAQHMADSVTRSHRHARDNGHHGLPHTYLAFKPSLYIVRIFLHTAQAINQQAQRTVGKPIAIRVGLKRRERLNGMIHRAHTGGEPEPLRRMSRECRV